MVFQEKLSKIEERPLRKYKILMVDKNWLYYNEMILDKIKRDYS